MAKWVCEEVGQGPISKRHGGSETKDDLGMRGKEEEESHEEGVEGVWYDGRMEKGGGREGECREMEEIAEGVDQDGVEGRQGDEQVRQLLEPPVMEETDIPVDSLDIGIDERQRTVAPDCGRRRRRTESSVGGVVVDDKWQGDGGRGEQGQGWSTTECSPYNKSSQKQAVGPQGCCQREPQRRARPLTTSTTQQTPVRQPAEQGFSRARRYVLRRCAQRYQRQRRRKSSHGVVPA